MFMATNCGKLFFQLSLAKSSFLILMVGPKYAPLNPQTSVRLPGNSDACVFCKLRKIGFPRRVSNNGGIVNVGRVAANKGAGTLKSAVENKVVFNS